MTQRLLEIAPSCDAQELSFDLERMIEASITFVY
uniref:Macaca fascicularis brain cDNA clone: QbsA-11533, similar to human pyruvate dehydrogenase phosphatase isoenzyme 2 (PDP2), mRNA, RefSeq: NM_020786.1 n=1 Tax=Macaca fascicularis TaxID=9541 RepID=I7GA97_MACFA|nr:unnamed protein product [Macaca fascicularis]